MQLLTYQNSKTVKGEKQGVLTAILYLAPHKLSGANLCPKASPGCISACLFTAGRGRMRNVWDARVRKAQYFNADPKGFAKQIIDEIGKAKKKAKRLGFQLAVRLNGTSDIVWERVAPEIFEMHSDVQFYDYTKIKARFFKKIPANYYLLFSRSEVNEQECSEVLERGGNVAVVFGGKVLPKEWGGAPVLDGDSSDARFLERGGHVVGLIAKGEAKKDTSGFVVYPVV